MEDMQVTTQMAMSVAMTKKSLDFEASMSSALINGSFEKQAEMAARSAGLAAEGIGTKIDIAV